MNSQTNRRQRILVFNPYNGGHYLEYVLHILRWVRSELDTAKSCRLSVLLPEECRADVGEFLELPVSFHWLDQPLERFSNVPVAKQIQLIESICSRDKIDVVFFPHLERAANMLQALKLKEVEYAGIMFTTFNRFGFPNEGLIKRIYRSARFLTKRLLDTYRMLGRKRWRHVFLLNDREAPTWYRKLPFLDVSGFSSIADPIEMSPLPPQDLHNRSDYGLCASKPLVVCVGDLRERKNAHTLVDAFEILAEQGNDAQLLIVGSGDARYTDQLASQIQESGLQNVQFHNRYADDEEFRWIVDNADVVAIPYIDFFRSSGVLNHAIQARTPILCGNVGLIFEAVKQCGLGAGVNPHDAADIAAALTKLTNGYEVSNQQIENYLTTNDPEPSLFAAKIFNDVLGKSI